jgi:hypothetical protein
MFPSLLSFLLLPLARCTAPYYVLNASSFDKFLGEDASWARQNIPLFESSNSTLTSTYYFRWRTYKRHIRKTNRTDGIDYVVTEFSPDVSWAGEYNTINCAAGHHIMEGRWLRDPAVIDSYTRWWVNPESRHTYFYWLAHAVRQRYLLTGNTSLVAAVLPDMITQFKQYAAGALPVQNANFNEVHDCLWNAPGNEGQENTISGPGCRPLVQSVLYGEAAAISALCSVVGNTSCFQEFGSEATLWRNRLLRLWNPSLQSFDTDRIAPPTPKPVPTPVTPRGYKLINHNTFCCDQTACASGHSTFLWEGAATRAQCEAKVSGLFSLCI